MQFFTHETLTGSVALKTTRELRLNVAAEFVFIRFGGLFIVFGHGIAPRIRPLK